MASAYWDQVVASGLAVPTDRPLDELTSELTTMLGSPDPRVRDGIAFPALLTWIGRGVYDDLLAGLGDGMTSGLATALGSRDDDTVFRRSFSALVLTECIDRDTEVEILSLDTILTWGDRISTWLVRENDLRGFVAGKGWAHSLAHGADAVGALARSPKFGTLELTVLLDVVADRLLSPTEAFLVSGEPDRLAQATMHVLRRDLVQLEVLEPWVNRLASHAVPLGHASNPFHVTGNVQAFLRSLHLQLALAPGAPAVRHDLLLVLLEALRSTNAAYLVAPREHDPAGSTAGF